MKITFGCTTRFMGLAIGKLTDQDTDPAICVVASWSLLSRLTAKKREAEVSRMRLQMRLRGQVFLLVYALHPLSVFPQALAHGQICSPVSRKGRWWESGLPVGGCGDGAAGWCCFAGARPRSMGCQTVRASCGATKATMQRRKSDAKELPPTLADKHLNPPCQTVSV